MKISKMVPIIVSVVLVLIWVYIGYATAVNYIEGRTASPGFYKNITLKEDVSYVDVGREIETALAAKRMEQTIMTAMPCGILLYMRLASPGFLDLMYTTALGIAIMTACLGAYAAAVLWSRKIVHIEV